MIEDIIRPMKKKGIDQGQAKSGNINLLIDLNSKMLYLEDQLISLTSRPATKGGEQWYFECPICFTRRRVLYYCEGELACGECFGLYRGTRNRTKTDPVYFWDLALKEMRKVDLTSKPKRGYIMPDDFPIRPKGMHFQTYLKHWRRFHKYYDKGIKLWMNGL